MNRSTTTRSTPRRGAIAAGHATLLGGVCLALALGLAAARADGTLYRWSEPDGALTFSPTPPTDGTPYVEVDPMTMQPRSTNGGDARTPATVAAPRATAPAPARTATTAASSGTGDVAPTTTAARHAPASVVTATEPAAAKPDDGRTDVVASSEKHERCGELRKRVVSLERRLSTPLTPEDMDNTVVHMARYQQSFDRHCR